MKQLNESELGMLRTQAMNETPLPKLTKKQEKQFMEYMIVQSNEYRNTHSMRSEILQRAIKAIYKIK